MDNRQSVRIGKLISLILRHEPQKIGIAALEPGGYVPVCTLLEGLARLGSPLSREELDELVRDSDKGRYSFDTSGTRIRANQGHSVPVDLGLDPKMPPAILYHGTPERFLEQIRRDGLQKMARHAVHLSPDEATATMVGQRRGRPVLLRIDARRMHEEGFLFTRSENGVWLIDAIPRQYIQFP
ncbi:RNA 2'-phosphotransferase [bacterium]|nr:MAG: RNA 2'-phosphotransferase [bacterium]